MELGQILKLIGLNEKQIKVYLACLQLGQDTVFNIAKKAELKRPTVYLILNELQIKGLVSQVKLKKHLIYSALNPKKILNIAKNNQKRIEQGIPALSALYNDTKNKPAIEIYEGKNGIETMYNDCLEYLERGEELLIIGSIVQFENYKYLLEIWENKIKQIKGKYKIRELNNQGEFTHKYYQQMKKYLNENYQIKNLPKNFQFFECDIFIYADKILVFSHNQDLFVISIKAKNISESLKNFFNLVWSKL